MLARQDRGSVCASVHLAAENGHDQVCALRKMAVNRSDADAGFLCNFSHGSIHSGRSEYAHGRLK